VFRFAPSKSCLSPHSRRPRGESGQSLVEFSLMVVALTTLLVGLLDLGRAYFTYLALKDAASEGAYFGSVFPQCASAADDDCAAPNNIEYRVRNTAPGGGLVNWGTVDIEVEAPDTTPGQTLTVTVAYEYDIITPFVGAIVGGQSIALGAESVAVIVTEATP
jgi:hypothetical protein